MVMIYFLFRFHCVLTQTEALCFRKLPKARFGKLKHCVSENWADRNPPFILLALLRGVLHVTAPLKFETHT
jgi:hypothetical protein